MLPALLAHSLDHSSLRLATYNVGCGFARKLPDLLTRCEALALDIIAVQEIGDPVITDSMLLHYSLVFSPGPSQHEAGVGLLIARALAPRCRAYKRSHGGRLVGVILELAPDRRLLIVSAYMPTGLDSASPLSPSIDVARRLYAEITDWSSDVHCHQVIVMGDLNETLTTHDRLPAPPPRRARGAVGALSTPLESLPLSGYTDVYRWFHPDAAASPGFTHVIDSAVRPSSSRIDYLWTLGVDHVSYVKVRIDRDVKLMSLSHHRLLWMEMLIPPMKIDDGVAIHRLRLPNLRAADDQHEQSFINHLERRVGSRVDEFEALAHSCEPHALNDVATALTTLTRRSAFATLPTTGARPLHSRAVNAMQHRREDITRLLRVSLKLVELGCMTLHLSPEWRRLHQRCIKAHGVRWITPSYSGCDTHAWIGETQSLVRQARAAIAKEKHRMAAASVPRFDANAAAAVHRMLQSDSLPSQLFSVVATDGALTSSASELKNVMVDHFTSVFAVPADRGDRLPYEPPAMLYDKPGILPEWYDGLMADVTEDELVRIISDAPRVSAPGQDEVAMGVWKIAIRGSPHTRSLVATLFSGCLRSSSFPAAWKSSIIIPFVKDALKERTMSNIRPISLQSCLGKLFNKILACRLALILARHPILNPAQRGFVTGGTTTKCIDELLDAWDHSRLGTGRGGSNGEQYTLFYDIKQAYDSVQASALLRALRRIHLPEAFVSLIADSLTGLVSSVRTVYGLTRAFDVLRSLRQGDPLAPLLFVILMDALHDGLDTHPRTLVQHGCRISSRRDSIYLASLGYADDTAAITNTLADLREQNEWVQYFMVFNLLRLNALKCELVGRRADGLPVTAADIVAADICIDGHALVPRAHDHPIRYLGVHACFDGSWAAQQKKSLAMISLFTRIVSKFKVSIGRAVYMFNVFLLPKLELALHYVHGAGTTKWLSHCDGLLVGSIKHASRSPLSLSHSAVALAVGLILPSRLETSIKVSELFLRLNSADPRWGELGRSLMRVQCASTVDASSHLHRPNSGTRMTRAALLVRRSLDWSAHLREASASTLRSSRRRQHLFELDPLALAPSPAECSSLATIAVSSGQTSLAHDAWSGWGSLLPSHSLDVYTDGSHEASTGTSSWAVVIGDRWFDDNYASIPIDESNIRPADVGGALLIGAAITCTSGVYPAELQAIARVLAMLPSSSQLHIHSDSLSSLQAISAFQAQPNERRRMRMSARPLLQLISHLITRRIVAHGSVRFSHVKAHSSGEDRDSVGNRMADYQANLARRRTDRSYPLTLRELPLTACESHFHVLKSDGLQVIDDVRQAATSQTRATALAHWSSKRDQGYFAGEAMIALGCVAMQVGSASQQATLVHVATDSIHFHWVADASGDSSVQPLRCLAPCSTALTLAHLAECPSRTAVRFRAKLANALTESLMRADCTHAWTRPRRSMSLARLLAELLPPPEPDPPPLAIDRHRHFVRSMVGAYTSAASNAAAKLVGFVSPSDGRAAMSQLRMISLDHIASFYEHAKLTDA